MKLLILNTNNKAINLDNLHICHSKGSTVIWVTQLARLLYLGVGVGVGDKADCLKKGPRPIGGMPSVGVFLMDPSPYLREFRRKPRD